MKKILLTSLSALLLCGCAISANNNDLDVLTLFSSKSKSENRVWVGTFQLVFNDMKENILKKDVEFVNEKPTKELIGLNKAEFNKTMLNENSYYTSYGETSLSEKEKIQKAIKEKFNEKSDILDLLDWKKEPGSFYAYAMLKKQFEFFEAFDKLGKFSFNNSKKQFEFFGIKPDSKEVLDDNVKVLFYNNKNDYAIQLMTKSNDIVYLYRTNENKDFKKLYEKMLFKGNKYEGSNTFSSLDTLKVPNLKIDTKKEYPELCNKTIKGTDFYFSQAIETIQLELDNQGGKVKSEAALMMKCNSLAPEEVKKPRHFNFDKTFIMFLVDADKKDPYLALRIKDLENIGK